MKALVIYGPPGTGKTSRLLSIMESEIERVDPSRIAFISFTRTAIEEARTRAENKFALSARDLPWFRTIHSLAYHALGLSRDSVMADYAEFAEQYNFNLSEKQDDAGEIVFSGRSSDDLVLYAHSLVEATGLSIEEVVRRWSMHSLNVHRLDTFADRLKEYKQLRRKVSFADMITNFIAQGDPIPVDVAFIDEAQDLTPAQWKLARIALKNAKRVYIAGDDDQAIYHWAGADWETMLAVRGEQEVLAQSYRVPGVVHEFAQQIVERIGTRKNKEWKPATHGGYFASGANLADLPIENGESWMLLARNSFSLSALANVLRQKGLLFRFNGSPSLTPQMLSAYKNGTIAPWKARYIERVQNVKAPINIDVSTIHRVKGAEADNVALSIDISRATNECLRSPAHADEEHRIFYVGATRAKKRLYLLRSCGDFRYPVP